MGVILSPALSKSHNFASHLLPMLLMLPMLLVTPCLKLSMNREVVRPIANQLLDNISDLHHQIGVLQPQGKNYI